VGGHGGHRPLFSDAGFYGARERVRSSDRRSFFGTLFHAGEIVLDKMKGQPAPIWGRLILWSRWSRTTFFRRGLLRRSGKGEKLRQAELLRYPVPRRGIVFDKMKGQPAPIWGRLILWSRWSRWSRTTFFRRGFLQRSGKGEKLRQAELLRYPAPRREIRF